MELFGITDPDVTLTDYGLTLLCAWIVWRIWKGPKFGMSRPWLLLFFAGAGLGAAFGGTVHGFFYIEGTPEYDVLWPASLISIGLAALGAWGVGARLVLRDAAASGIIGLATLVFVVYCGVVISGSQSFAVAVTHYLPAAVFLLLAIFITNRRAPHTGFRLALLGLLLTFAAALIQQQRIGLHPVAFDHNALYHVVQAIALVLIYVGLTRALRR
jgi:hypothetical protein